MKFIHSIKTCSIISPRSPPRTPGSRPLRIRARPPIPTGAPADEREAALQGLEEAQERHAREAGAWERRLRDQTRAPVHRPQKSKCIFCFFAF